MEFSPTHIFEAGKHVLSKRNYLLGFFALTLIIFSIFVAIPVLLTPANSLLFQLAIFTIKDYFILIFLSALTALLIVMHVFVYKNAKANNPTKAAIGGGAALIAAVFGTAGCSACLAALLGFLGIGTVFLLLEYQWQIVTMAVIIMLVSLYLTSEKVNGVCKNC